MTTSVPVSRTEQLTLFVVYCFVLVALPLAALEGCVRLLGWRTANDPHLNFGRAHSFFEDVQIEGEAFKKVKARQLYREREVMFSARKDSGVFRIFCVDHRTRCACLALI
jgi:hypothetical protein